jgi:hypothetical protein
LAEMLNFNGKAQIAQSALQRPPATQIQPSRSPAPVFHRKNAKLMPTLSNAALYAELDEHDTAKQDLR